VNQRSDDHLAALSEGWSREPEVHPGVTRLLAVDQTASWAAAFYFGLFDDGDWATNTLLLRRVGEGWEEMTRWVERFGLATSLGGAERRLERSTVHISEPQLHRGGGCIWRGGRAFSDDRFAASGISGVKVTCPHDEHVANVVAPASAVVVVVVGSGRLTALDQNGHAVGPSRLVD